MPIESPPPGDYFDPAHRITKRMFADAKMEYPKSADEKALELKMDKIRTYDGKYNFKNSVVRLCRYLNENGEEYLDTEEVIEGLSSIGNKQEYWARNNNYSHGEPDVSSIATLQNGEQIIVTGEFIKHIKRVFELPWADFKANKDGIRDRIMNNIKGNRDKLLLRVEGTDLPRSYAGSYKKWWDVWFNYEWDDLMFYCETGVKKDDVDSMAKHFSKLPAEKQKQLLATIGARVKQ